MCFMVNLIVCVCVCELFVDFVKERKKEKKFSKEYLFWWCG